MNKRKLELFKPEMLTEFYRKIFRDGSFASSAGDFWEPELNTESLADALNEILNAQLGPEVFGHWDGVTFTVPDPKLGLRSGTSTPDTHRCFLIGLEEISKVECSHPEEYRATYKNNPNKATCAKCNVVLTAKWEAVESGK